VRAKAGRKALGKESVIIRLRTETNEALKQAAADAQTSKSEYAEVAIVEKLKKESRAKTHGQR
jgi:hypothetical protein